MKILIITSHSHNNVGGIETYSLKIIHLLLNNFKNIEIDEFITESDNLSSNLDNVKIIRNNYKKSKINFIDYYRKIINTRNSIYLLNYKNKYDLIIDNTSYFFKKLNNLNHYIWVQHFDITVYDNLNIKNRFKRICIKLYKKIFLRIKNPFLNNYNIVVFDNETSKIIINSLNRNAKLPLPNIISIGSSNNFNEINNIENRKRIIYFGRIDETQKNISKLIQINKKINLIDFYGDVTDNREENLKLLYQLKINNFYKGKINKNDLNSILQKYKYMILYSTYEGFPVSIVESLSNALPIIVRNSFLSASYLCNKSTGFLLNYNFDKDDLINKILEIYNINNNSYINLVRNLKIFFSVNLDISVFNKKWLDLINKCLKLNKLD